MKHRILSLLLAACLVLGLCACGGTVGDIAGSVVNAAKTELENQVKRVLEENKLNVVELKTAFGQLNDEGPKYQLFVAALVKSNGEAIPQATADTLGKLFTEAGLTAQTGSAVESEYLVHKEITFKHEDYSDGTYYVIYAYQKDLTIELPELNLTGK